MTIRARAILGLLALSGAITGPTEAASYRSRAVVAEFIKATPCPSPGPGSCFHKHYEADHRIPLCFGGADAIWNLQWLSIKEHDAKTILDLRACAMKRKVSKPQ